MRTVGIFDAKTRLSELVAEAERGETIVITRKGEPVAQLGPLKAQTDARERARRAYQLITSVADAVRERGSTSTQEEIKSWINEGRP
jgi:prevent-host-death family protein